MMRAIRLITPAAPPLTLRAIFTVLVATTVWFSVVRLVWPVAGEFADDVHLPLWLSAIGIAFAFLMFACCGILTFTVSLGAISVALIVANARLDRSVFAIWIVAGAGLVGAIVMLPLGLPGIDIPGLRVLLGIASVQMMVAGALSSLGELVLRFQCSRPQTWLVLGTVVLFTVMAGFVLLSAAAGKDLP